jgi:hypothetical protein
VTLDPHKLLYQPYECGCLLVREAGALRTAFEIVPPYLGDVETTRAGEVNLCDHGLQLSRTSRALKIWLSLHVFGVDAFRRAIDKSLDLAAHAASRAESSAALELLAPAPLGIVCLRRRFAGVEDELQLARLNAGLAAALEESGTGFVSSTSLRGRYALRLCPLNHATERAHVDEVLDFLERDRPPAAAAARVPARAADIGRTWLRSEVATGGTGASADLVGTVTAFASLGPDGRERVAELASVVDVAAGETVVQEWDVTRDFYVVLDGELAVSRDGSTLATLGPGGFFGEIAALDWGKGYGYPRTATVTACSPVRLLVFPEGALEPLLRLSPALARDVRRSVAERLPG